jgi:oxygen-independent coproporphyrinogen III oxidase
MRAGLYIHFPYCVKKCLYCDFNSAASDPQAREEYPKRLLQEMALRQALLPEPVRAATLYFGGGTPSLMTTGQVGSLIDAASRLFQLEPEAEITLEANPGTLTPEKLAGYRAAGVNRVSLGIQSFDDRLLTRLGRVHTKKEAIGAYQACRAAGFDNLSIDLMHSLPEQTPDQWRESLRQGIALSPEHISAYALSVEDDTPFAALHDAGKLPLPDEEAAATMFETTSEQLQGAGYQHYEISNFALPGRQARHNSAYWSRASYLGFGAGAHSFWNPDGLGERWSNAEDPKVYGEAISQDTLPEHDREALTLEQAVAESFFLGLRALAGLNLDRLVDIYGPAVLQRQLDEVESLVSQGLLLRKGGLVRLAPQKVIIANSIFARFL